MIIADTSIWIEFLKGREKIFNRFENLLKMRQIIAIECIFGELLQGARSNAEAKVIRAYWENLPKINELGIWIAAGELSAQEKLYSKGVGLIDLAILASAKRHRFKVWSLDKRLMAALRADEKFN